MEIKKGLIVYHNGANEIIPVHIVDIVGDTVIYRNDDEIFTNKINIRLAEAFFREKPVKGYEKYFINKYVR